MGHDTGSSEHYPPVEDIRALPWLLMVRLHTFSQPVLPTPITAYTFLVQAFNVIW